MEESGRSGNGVVPEHCVDGGLRERPSRRNDSRKAPRRAGRSMRNCLGCGIRFRSKGIHNRQCEECAARLDWPPTGSVLR